VETRGFLGVLEGGNPLPPGQMGLFQRNQLSTLSLTGLQREIGAA